MANPTTLTEFLQNLPIPWLCGNPEGQANAGAIGQVLDDQVDQLRQAVKAHMPTLAPADALPHIASERGLIQGPGESNSAFALRLQDAWDEWVWAGTWLGVLAQLQLSLGYASGNFIIVQQSGLAYSLTGTVSSTDPSTWPTNLVTTTLGTNQNLSGSPPWWRFDYAPYGAPQPYPLNTEQQNTAMGSRYALIFYGTLPASWTNIVSPPTPSTAPSLSEVNTIRKILRAWSPARMTCMGIFVVTAGMSIGWPVRLINSGFNAGADIGPSTVVPYSV